MNNLITLFSRIAGDEKAFDELFYTWSPRVRRIVKNYVKDEAAVPEIVHDVFLKVWLKKDMLHTIENPVAWLTRITVNGCLNYIRTVIHHTVLLPVHETGTVAGSDEELQVKHLKLLIRKGVEELPRQRRMIYIMSKEQHLNRREIASQLNISEHTVKNQLSSSLMYLQEYLARHSGIHLPALLLLSLS